MRVASAAPLAQSMLILTAVNMLAQPTTKGQDLTVVIGESLALPVAMPQSLVIYQGVIGVVESA
jgi:hypothetical protein